MILQSRQHEIELVTRLGSPAGKRTPTSFWGTSSSPSNGLFCTGTLPTACRPEPLRLWTTPVRRRPLSTKFLVATWGRMSPVSSADTSRPLSNTLWTSCWTSVRFQPLKRLCGNTSDRSESTTTCTSARGARSKFQLQRGRWISLFISNVIFCIFFLKSESRLLTRLFRPLQLCVSLLLLLNYFLG